MNHLILYTKPDCHPCKAVKADLKRNDIAYEEIDVSENPEALERLIRNGIQTAPAVAYAGKIGTIADLPGIKQLILTERKTNQ